MKVLAPAPPTGRAPALIARKALIAAMVLTAAIPAVGRTATEYWAFGDSVTRGEGGGVIFDPPAEGSLDCGTASPYPTQCGYHWRLEDALELEFTNTVLNRGVGGETTGVGKSRIDDVGEPLETTRCTDPDASDVVLIMEGTNDISQSVSTTTIETNLEAMVDLATTKCVHSVLASTIRRLKAGTPDGDKTGAPGHAATSDLATMISDLADEKNRAYANIWAPLCPTQACYGFNGQSLKNFWGRINAGDPGHITGKGYNVMAPVFEAVILADPLPGAVTLSGPTGDVTDDTPPFSWDEDTDADWYFLEIDGSGVWHAEEEEQVVDVDMCVAGTCTYDPGVPLADGDHSWRVRTRNLRGVGSWSSTSDFTVWTTAPGATSTTTPSGDACQGASGPYNPTFDWTAASDAKDYQVQIEDASMTVVLDEVFSATTACSGPACSISPTSNLPAGTYTWRARATNPFADGAWSADRAFSLFPSNLSAPSQTYPFGDLFDTTPTYRWVHTEGTEDYDLDIDAGVTTYAASAVCTGSSCEVAGAALGVGSHSWEVTAKNRCDPGITSGSIAFDVLTCSPVTNDLPSAVEGGTLVELACVDLIAGNLGTYTVEGPNGDVTFHAGDTITLHNGFLVEADAEFTAIVDE